MNDPDMYGRVELLRQARRGTGGMRMFRVGCNFKGRRLLSSSAWSALFAL